jgi:hypothetical protein
MAKLTPDQKVQLLAKNLCKMVGIEAVDPMDGSANWFMFADEAKKIIADLESRGFQVWEWIDLVKAPRSASR